MILGCGDPVHAKFQGLKIADKNQIEEIEHFANSFAYWPQSTDDLKDILNHNQGRLLPWIEMARYFFNSEKGIYEWRDITELKRVLGQEKIVIALDEPLWYVRRACTDGKVEACSEIAINYKTTQAIFTRLKYELGYQMAHIEAYQELNLQKQARPNKNVIMIKSADHVAFDCYGHFDSCGGRPQTEYGQWVYDTIKGTGKKMLLIPGAFDFDGVIQQLHDYFDIYKHNQDIFSGLGVFTWGDSNGIKGARNYPEIAAEVERLMLEIK